jgi:hypothetical protein
VGYYRITVKMKWGQEHSGIRFSRLSYPFQRQKEYEDKAYAAYGKDKVSDVTIQALPDDHPDVINYLRKKDGGAVS